MKRAAVVATLAIAAGVADADDPVERPTGIEVDREAPPPGRAEFSFDGGAPIVPPDPAQPAPRAWGWAASVQLEYLDRPLTLRTHQLEIEPVQRRQTVAFGAALAIGPAFVVDARLPMSHQTGPRLQGLGDDRPLDRWVLGDLGLGARVRLVQRDAYAAFVRGQLTLGTGDDFDFAGEPRLSGAWLLVGRATPTERLTIAGTAGVRFRGREVAIADRVMSDELLGAVGVAYQLPALRGLYCDANAVRVTGELVGVLGNDIGDSRGPSPAEARFGVVSRIRPWWAVAARVSTGLNDQIGAPRLRALLELVYVGGTR